jgi:hypothetical protein
MGRSCVLCKDGESPDSQCHSLGRNLLHTPLHSAMRQSQEGGFWFYGQIIVPGLRSGEGGQSMPDSTEGLLQSHFLHHLSAPSQPGNRSPPWLMRAHVLALAPAASHNLAEACEAAEGAWCTRVSGVMEETDGLVFTDELCVCTFSTCSHIYANTTTHVCHAWTRRDHLHTQMHTQMLALHTLQAP